MKEIKKKNEEKYFQNIKEIYELHLPKYTPKNIKEQYNYGNEIPHSYEEYQRLMQKENERENLLRQRQIEQENINIEAIKIWQDFNNEYEKRPDEVVFNLFRDGIFAGKSLKPSKENDWKVVFENLRKTGVNGNEFVYSIIEDFMPFYKTPDAGYINGEDNKTHPYIKERVAKAKT